MYFSDKTYGSSQTALGNCYRFAISKMLIAVQKLIVLFIIIFGTLSFLLALSSGGVATCCVLPVLWMTSRWRADNGQE